MYAVGSQGINVSDDLAIDFRVITSQGAERIIDAAFAHAQRTNRERVTVVTKANIVKTTDGKFLDIARKVSERYPDIEWDGWYIDIMTAALINPARQKDFQVLALPNLYGGHPHGRSRADSGRRWHGRAARTSASDTACSRRYTAARRAWWRTGRAQFADPSSLVRAGAMMLEHIGFEALGGKLHKALDHLRAVRAQDGDDRAGHRRYQRGVRRVHHADGRGPECGGALG